jgi:hypothetical protein
VSLIQADPGMADVLASVPDNTVPGGHHFGGHAPAAPVAARIWESSTAVYLSVVATDSCPSRDLHRAPSDLLSDLGDG